MQIKDIIIASSNEHKIAEIKRFFASSNCSVKICGLNEFAPIDPPVEDAATFRENACLKARYYSQKLNSWVLADDSGLEVDALNGAPGVHSARFAGVDGPDRDRANNQKLLSLMQNIPTQNRQAAFCCSMCLYPPCSEVKTDIADRKNIANPISAGADGQIIEVEARWPGLIISQPRGGEGFGYDPLFYIPQLGKTAAELTQQEKNEISHRGQALRLLLEALQ